MLKRSLVTFFAAFLLNSIALADDPPAWLKQAAATNVPTYGKEVHAVALHDEARKTVEEDGRVKTVNYYAVRILSREGRKAAVARVGYSTDYEKVKELRAWLIRPNGEVKSYGKKEVMDIAVAENDVYNEARLKVISAGDDADAGCVFGYEIATDEKSVFSQFVWYFQHDIPVLLSRLTVTTPQGWRADSVTFNHDKLEPAVNGASYTWELRNLSWIEREAAGPELTNLAPRLAVNLYPGAGKATP